MNVYISFDVGDEYVFFILYCLLQVFQVSL